MRSFLLFFVVIAAASCFTKTRPGPGYNYGNVWGNKPVYAAFSGVKTISYSTTALPVVNPGNIYVKDNIIFQVELGKGIHVIDNSIPAQAHRVGFINVSGNSQLSIKGNYLYSNNYDDLVVIDIRDVNNVHEANRVYGAFPEGKFYYYLSQPEETGYYQCIKYDSVVVGWVKDSIQSNNCYK